MADVDRFLADPVDFMQNNVVDTPATGGSLDTGGVKFFTLEKKAYTAKSRERPGVNIPVYLARPTSSGGTDPFDCYWCPYEDGQMKSIMVGNLANIMLTAPMDGCSFGIGSATAKGDRMVCHINMKGQTNMHGKQNAILKGSKLAEGLVDPTIYMAGGNPVHVTTFGVRNAKTQQWSFYYQLATVGATGTGRDYTLEGVMPVL
ncbi:MAG: hypothetical protein WBF04_11335 [Candidatus Sulfotelmatobacter sp.]